MVGFLVVVLVVIVGGGILSIGTAIAMSNHHSVRPNYRGGERPDIRSHPTYGPVRRATIEMGKLDQQRRHSAMYDEVNQHHAKRKKSILKFLRGETTESIEADRQREIGLLAGRLRNALHPNPGKQRRAGFATLHPKSGEIKSHGIGRDGHGTRALIPKPESSIVKSIRGNKKKKS